MYERESKTSAIGFSILCTLGFYGLLILSIAGFSIAEAGSFAGGAAVNTASYMGLVFGGPLVFMMAYISKRK